MNTPKHLKKFVVVAVALFSVLLTPSVAHAYDSKVVVRGEIACNTVRCHQVKVVTLYTHGSYPVVKKFRRTAPLEERTWDRFYHWSSWKLVSVY
jgi:hypothetical protein